MLQLLGEAAWLRGLMGVRFGKPCSDCFNGVNYKVLRLKRWSRERAVLLEIQPKSNFTWLTEKVSVFRMWSEHLKTFYGISYFEYFPNKTDINPTGSHHRNESSLGIVPVSIAALWHWLGCSMNKFLLFSYLIGTMTKGATHDLLSFHSVLWFLAPNFAFLEGSPLAYLEPN